MAPGSLPPDLPALMRKRKAEEDSWKPKFVSKKERERLAAEKASQAAEDAAKEKEQDAKAAKRAKTSRENGSGTDSRQSPAIPNAPRAMLQQQQQQQHQYQQQQHSDGPRSNGRGKNDDEEQRRATWKAKDEADFRSRYMGPLVNQSTFSAKKKRHRNTANKFKFDWDPEDDTSRPDDVAKAPVLRKFGNETWTEEQRQYKAEMLRRGENGEARAAQFLAESEKALQHAARRTFGEHWSKKTLEDMKQRDWRILKENYGIATKGGNIPNPMRSWGESGLPGTLLDIVAKVGYDEPTPIQRAAIPIALQARDLIGVAVTGSGKTAAFLLPLLVYISKLPALNEETKNDGPYALILAPTRELVQQIETEAKKFAAPLGFTVVSIVGGHSLEEQAYALRNGAEIIVATPGRLVDCLERRLLVFSQCCYMIMDEADRMIDQGFEEPLTKILDALPVSNEKPDTDDAENPLLMGQYFGDRDRYRQTMMYTATMPSAVEKIAQKYLRRPAIVTIGNAGEAVDTVEQRAEFVPGEDKRKKRLQEILNSHQFKPPIIVFVNTKGNCEMVARDVRGMGFSAVTLHGSKTQEQREAALLQVRNGQTEVLVATDLAGRGIDVPGISLVVNFNMAKSIESYTHRIGRTGRAGKKGVAITFLGEEDNPVLYDLAQVIDKSPISKLPDELRRHEAAQQKHKRGGGM